MFSLRRTEKSYEKEARAIYAGMLAHVRNPEFYERYQVPDDFYGRFELLTVHLFAVMHVLKDKDFNQALFDAAFADMDQSLREAGIGDMGVPKRMRRLMKSFNGRMHAYEKAIDDRAALEEALRRNMYGAVEAPDEEAVRDMADYMIECVARLKRENPDEIKFGEGGQTSSGSEDLK